MTLAISGGRAAPVALPSTAPVRGSGSELLPEPSPLSPAGAGDAMSMLYGLLCERRQSDLKVGESRIEEQRRVQHKAFEDVKAALQRQKEAERHHDFFSDVAHAFSSVAEVALAAGAVATTVATAGAGSFTLVGAGLLLSAGGTAVQQTHCFGDASSWIGLGLDVAGAGLGVAGGFGAATGGKSVLARAGAIATGIGGGADVGAGASTVVAGHYAADAQSASADAEQARLQADRLEKLVGWVIDEMKQADESHQRAQQALHGAMQTKQETAVSAAGSVTLKG